MKCPNKIKHFLWRFGHNSHPLRSILARRGMKICTRCPVCNQLGEDGGHLFFKCKTAKELWRALELEEDRCILAQSQSATEAVEHVLKATEQRKYLMIVVL